ncbi:MAG: pyridoxamine 5'-phosphate oxidase family protein [Treponema sp.]|nr:pyridoxamine 5'-phosphate oxidase family protein [Treponema sp.]
MNMRRKDRETTREEALLILDRASWGVLSVADHKAAPYCVPLSFIRETDWLYFHCAMEGHKLEILRARPKVCITFVGNVEFPENCFTAVYESAIVFGTAEEVTNDKEKLHGLRILSERFIPGNMHAFENEAAQMLSRTAVWKIHIDEITGKRRKYP